MHVSKNRAPGLAVALLEVDVRDGDFGSTTCVARRLIGLLCHYLAHRYPNLVTKRTTRLWAIVHVSKCVDSQQVGKLLAHGLGLEVGISL